MLIILETGRMAAVLATPAIRWNYNIDESAEFASSAVTGQITRLSLAEAIAIRRRQIAIRGRQLGPTSQIYLSPQVLAELREAFADADNT